MMVADAMLCRVKPLRGWKMSTKTHFLRRGTRIVIVFGRYAGLSGIVDANVLAKSLDSSPGYATAFRVQLDDGALVTVRTDQVAQH